MDSLRFFLYAGLAFLGFLLYTDWQNYKNQNNTAATTPAATIVSDVPQQQPASSGDKDIAQTVPTSSATSLQSTTLPPALEQDQPAPKALTQAAPAGAKNATSSQYVTISTDVFEILIDKRGASIVSTKLLAYPAKLGSEEQVNLQSTQAERFYIYQSGLVGGNNNNAPNHFSNFTTEKDHYKLTSDSLEVSFYATENNLQVIKTFSFKRSDYLIEQQTIISNQTQRQWQGNEYRQIQRTNLDESRPFIYTYTGGVYYNQQDKYEKITYDKMEDKDFSASFDHGWAAMLQHYFMTAMIPNPQEKNKYYTRVIDGKHKHYILGMLSPNINLAAGESTTINSSVYIGPKILKSLRKIAPGLELAVDFGVLTIISKPMFLVLDFLHTYLKNWGFAIIFLTLGLKLLFFPLAHTSYKSMAKMKKIMPDIQRLKERYGDDRQRMAKEQMELFKKHQVNPMSGCLPMIIQMPFFMGLYWALLESVELRQAPFMLWIHDLSIPDPYFILPVLMGLTMFITQKLNPPPSDPMQAKIMQLMPIIFSVIFFLLPAGLVLYSVTNSTLSIIQQWVITRQINKPSK